MVTKGTASRVTKRVSKALAAVGASGGSATATGGTITESGGYRIHTFTSSGDFVVSGGSLDVEYLIVAGGGAGSAIDTSAYCTGGGGGGGFEQQLGATTSVSAQTYPVIVGAGAAAALIPSAFPRSWMGNIEVIRATTVPRVIPPPRP